MGGELIRNPERNREFGRKKQNGRQNENESYGCNGVTWIEFICFEMRTSDGALVITVMNHQLL